MAGILSLSMGPKTVRFFVCGFCATYLSPNGLTEPSAAQARPDVGLASDNFKFSQAAKRGRRLVCRGGHMLRLHSDSGRGDGGFRFCRCGNRPDWRAMAGGESAGGTKYRRRRLSTDTGG